MSFCLVFVMPLCMSVYLCLVVTCWERAYLLTLLCVAFPCVFVTFPYNALGQVWYLIITNPNRCLLLYFDRWRVTPDFQV